MHEVVLSVKKINMRQLQMATIWNYKCTILIDSAHYGHEFKTFLLVSLVADVYMDSI